MKWVAFFSQTGSEILEISERLGYLPDRIVMNNDMDRKLNPELVRIARNRFYNIRNKPTPFEYYENIQAGDLVTLHGWLRIVPKPVCDRFKIYNGHPGLITTYPELKGKDPQKKAFELKHKDIGCIIHKVTSEVDGGEIQCCKITRNIYNNEEELIHKLHDMSVSLWVDFLIDYHDKRLKEKMSPEQYRKFMLDILETVDHDIAKQYDEERAEEPEYVEGSWNDLESIGRQYNLIDY